MTVAQSAEEIYRRAQELGLRRPPLEEWDTFPFEGDIRVRPLKPPVDEEPPRHGEDASDCWRCANAANVAIWSDERWLVYPFPKPSGLPVVVILAPREHLDFGDLSADAAAELGQMLVRAERAVARVDHVARVHVCKWGDGSFHLHWWLMARPSRLPQLIGSFAAIWDDILPPVPEDVWRDNLATVARALAEGGGVSHV